MSDTDDAHAPKDITIIENQDVDSTANRRRNNVREVADDDEDYRLITERRENEESMEAKEYDAARALLRLSRKPRKVKTPKTIKKTIETKRRPLLRGKTKKKRKRKKGKSHKKKKISRRGKK
jgi:hypothetical protein